MASRLIVILIGVVVTLLIVLNSVYTITEMERAVLLRFSKVHNADVVPGLHFKLPFVDDVRIFDGRVLTVDAPAERFLTLEKKALIVDSFAKFRIRNVSKYYTATSGDQRLQRNCLSNVSIMDCVMK